MSNLGSRVALSHSPRGELSHPSRLSPTLLAMELAAVLGLLALYKRGSRPFGAFLDAPAGWVFVFACVVGVAGGVVLVRALRHGRGRTLMSTAGHNLLAALVVVVTAEAMVRLVSTTTATGVLFGGRLPLLPKSWNAVAARNREVLARARRQGSFLVFDPQLGWTVGRSRSSGDYNRNDARAYAAQQHLATGSASDGGEARSPSDRPIYVSSAEGLRSAHVGVALSSSAARHRIALLGDSFTFGLEVYYEDTWGGRLEQSLGDDYQVLNFGVDGYGVDQATLRYGRDVAAWHPEVVVLAVIDDDFRRTMCVYGFLCFPGFTLPFAKPRFVETATGVEPLNLPLPAPESLFAARSIASLPFISSDISFDPVEWETHSYQSSYAVRLMLTHFRRWVPRDTSVSESALRRVNTALITGFLRRVRADGAEPEVVYLPMQSDFAPGQKTHRAKDLLRQAGIPFIDMTGCVAAVRPEQRFVTLHYSAAANAAVAACLKADLAHDALLDKHAHAADSQK